MTTEKTRKGGKDADGAGTRVLAGLNFLITAIVLVVAFAMSWENLYQVGDSIGLGTDLEVYGFKINTAHAFPLVIDGLIVGLTIQRIINAKRGRRLPVANWILNGFIGGTIIMNATSGTGIIGTIGHAVPAISYLTLAEVNVHSILAKYKMIEDVDAEAKRRRIRPASWILAPFTTWTMWRTMTLAGTSDVTAYSALAEAYTSQVRQWQTAHGWRATMPLIGVSRHEWALLRGQLSNIAIRHAGNSTTDAHDSLSAEPPLSEGAHERPAHALTERPDERPMSGAHPLSERPDERRSDRSVSAAQALSERPAHALTERPAHLPDERQAGTAQPPKKAANGTESGEAPGVPNDVVEWLHGQWEEERDPSGSDIGKNFNKSSQTGRRWRQIARSHFPELCKHTK